MSVRGVAATIPFMPKRLFSRIITGISIAPFLKIASKKDQKPLFVAWKKEIVEYA